MCNDPAHLKKWKMILFYCKNHFSVLLSVSKRCPLVIKYHCSDPIVWNGIKKMLLSIQRGMSSKIRALYQLKLKHDLFSTVFCSNDLRCLFLFWLVSSGMDYDDFILLDHLSAREFCANFCKWIPILSLSIPMLVCHESSHDSDLMPQGLDLIVQGTMERLFSLICWRLIVSQNACCQNFEHHKNWILFLWGERLVVLWVAGYWMTLIAPIISL